MTEPVTITPEGNPTLIYSLRGLAAKVGVHPQTLKRHIYKTKILAGIGVKVGNTLAFADDDVPKVEMLLASARGSGNTRLNKAQVLKRQLRALALQEAGHSLSEIAHKLKFKDTSGAWRAIQAATKKQSQTNQKG